MEKMNLGGLPAYIIETKTGVDSGSTFIMGKRSYYPFPDRPYFTIRKDLVGAGYSGGHYDLGLVEAFEDLIERAGV